MDTTSLLTKKNLKPPTGGVVFTAVPLLPIASVGRATPRPPGDPAFALLPAMSRSLG